MKKIVIVLALLFASTAFAGEKEELALKRDLLRERLTRMTYEHQILTTRIPALEKEFEASKKELIAVEEKMKEGKKEP